MADVTIVNQPPQVQPAAGSSGQPQTGASQSLTPGTVVAGTIIGKDTGGNFLLRTPQGTIALKSSTPLTYNSDVTIRIDSAGAGSTNARILTVNGEPFDEFSAPTAQASDTVSTSQLAQAASSPAETPTTLLRAVVISSPPPAAAPENAASPQSALPQTGASVIVRQATPGAVVPQSAAPAAPQTTEESLPANVAKLLSPQPAPVQTNTAGTPAAAPAAATSTATPEEESIPAALATQSAQPADAPVVSTVSYAAYAKQSVPTPVGAPEPNLTASTSSSQPVGAPAPAAANVSTQTTTAVTATASASPQAPVAQQTPAALPAQIIAANNEGVITLATPLGTLTLKADTPPASFTLTPGTQVLLESTVLPAASQLTAANVASAPASLPELASSWQTLSDIVTVLTATNSEAATQLLSSLPQMSPQFIATSLPFMAALAQGNVQGILGKDTLDILQQKGRTDLIEKFSAELNDIQQAFTPQTTRTMPGWTMLFLPFVYQEELQQARFFIKREPPKKTRDSKESKDTRFIVEVDFSELGPMQMDGLVREKAESTAFDLVIRTHTPFSQDAQTEICAIYNNAAQLTGFRGSISFQASQNFPVTPMEEAAASAARNITV